MNVRVRIAPSPTGFAHVGTAYIALFNWAYARKHHGAFILRLEDTDIRRQVATAETAIYEALDWLGLTPDESPQVDGPSGPYRQSERLDSYREIANKLVDQKLASEKDGAVWLKIPPNTVFSWLDAVRGPIEFQSQHLKDWVILKSDGYPAYNFANVVDDSQMGITQVIRGEEHISNTPLQLSAYQALGITPPTFAHLPVLRSADHKKLSKRLDPVSLGWFREQGYLPEAILNFLALQGWSHPQEKDIFSKEEFVELMTLARVKTSAPIFDFKKLDWINNQYIKSRSNTELSELIGSEFAPDLPSDLVIKTAPLVKERLRRLAMFPDAVSYFHLRPTVDPALVISQTKKSEQEQKKVLEQVISSLTKLDKWTVQELDKTGHELLTVTKWTPKELFMTIRVAITGRTATPPLFETMEVLGKSETLKRVRQTLNHLIKRSA